MDGCEAGGHVVGGTCVLQCEKSLIYLYIEVDGCEVGGHVVGGACVLRCEDESHFILISDLFLHWSGWL